MRAAVEQGWAALNKGSAVDAVEAAVRYMEDSGEFNAGRGACLTAEGTVQLDAAIMEGKGREGAGVGLCDCTHNPVSLTRFIMENTDHALIAGDECARFARLAGIKIEKQLPSEKAKELLAEMKAMMKKDHPRNYSTLLSMQDGNTVGAVAIDNDGVPAAAVSTGGTWMKLPGRIGDSAILGAGIYADGTTGAACATGRGEAIIKSALCWNACAYMKDAGAPSAAKKSIALISKLSGPGTAGIVTVDLKGRVGFAYNTKLMGRAWYDTIKDRVVAQF